MPVLGPTLDLLLRLHLRLSNGRLSNGGRDRGDVPGWVLITLMTAGLVAGLWAIAGPKLEQLLNDALSTVKGP
jgi:hypothetical protein